MRQFYAWGGAALLIATLSCGQIKLGASTQNDAIPQGTAILSGDFTGGATGVAYLYRNFPSADVVRLELISGPSPYTSYKAVGYYSGGPASGVALSPGQLKAETGNMNFSTGITSQPTWTKVQIELISNPSPGVGVAIAPLH